MFRTEIKIQAIDFLLRYPDFLSIELMDLMSNDSQINRDEIRSIIKNIYKNSEPVIRAEEMEKFFHGAYESIDDVIAFLVSVGFVQHDSKKRVDGKDYDKNYYLTNLCYQKVEAGLKDLDSVKWYFERCKLIEKYFGKFSGTELKTRQYRYSEYSNISYRSYISNVNEKVKTQYFSYFKEQLL